MKKYLGSSYNDNRTVHFYFDDKTGAYTLYLLNGDGAMVEATCKGYGYSISDAWLAKVQLPSDDLTTYRRID